MKSWGKGPESALPQGDDSNAEQEEEGAEYRAGQHAVAHVPAQAPTCPGEKSTFRHGYKSAKIPNKPTAIFVDC